MSAIVVDTSVWVGFFRGRSLPGLERALGDGDVVLSPIVAAELTSAPLTGAERRRLEDFLRDLPLADTPFDHWLRVGHLRAVAADVGLSVATPDAHVAQTSLDLDGVVWSNDAVFARLAAKKLIRCFTP